MTRVRTTWLTSIALGFTVVGTAAAQSPDQPQQPDDKETPLPPAPPPPSDVPSPSETPPASESPPPVETPAPTTTTTTIQTQPADTYNTTIVTTDADVDDYETRYGIGISAGAGAGGFTNDQLRGTSDVGADYGVRLTIGTRSPLALEASYIGSAQRITALGLDDNAYLVGNGVQGALRINTTIGMPVQPFLFAGFAWRRYDLANTATNLSDVDDVDNVVEVPLGVGMAGLFSGFMLDVRGEFRPAFEEDLVPEITESNLDAATSAPMHRWGVTANLGYEF